MIVDPYLRKSSADGGKSVAQQDDELTDGIAAEGWEVGRRFTDDARSASRYARKRRESYEALVAHIAAGACEAIGIWEVARGGRRESTYFDLLELARDHGTRIYVHTHGRLYDLRRRSDWKVFAQEIVDAADYSAKISEGATRGKRMRARAGLADGRNLDGYRTVRDEKGAAVGREIDEQRAPIVRRMAALALAGHSSVAIARELNGAGYVTARGAAYRPEDVGRILCNPGYAALRVYRAGQPDEQVFEGKWPRLIGLDDHRRLVAKYRDPARRTQRGTEPRWLLTGIAECGRDGCGGPMRATRKNGAARYFCLACGKLAVTADPVDDLVSRVLLARLALPDAAALFAPPSTDAAAQAARSDVAELCLRLDSFRAGAVAGSVSAASFAEIEAALLPKLAAAEAKAAKLSTPPALQHFAGVDIPGEWDGLSVTQRREIVRYLLRVRILPAEKKGQRFRPERVDFAWR